MSVHFNFDKEGKNMKNVIIIKNKLDACNPEIPKRNRKNAEESIRGNSLKEYQCSLPDAEIIKDNPALCNSGDIIMLVNYMGSGEIFTKVQEINKTQIESIYIGYIEKVGDDSKIYYLMKKCINNKRVIINLLDGVDMDVQDDFKNHSYIMIRSVQSFTKTIEDILITTMSTSKKDKVKYHELKQDSELAAYAQKNDLCKRKYGIREEDKRRSEFQRDRERIVNSKAFRRLVDKAQVFSAEKGDHYRTRMTHTLEVNQIAKAISLGLHLNMDLTEAIALAHDLGHTPFGHQGERTIRDILFRDELPDLFHLKYLFEGENTEEGKKEKLFGGFKHNYQSIRVLTRLEEKYVEYPGLDISFQVLEGVLKHTKLRDVELSQYISEDIVEELHIEQTFCANLEGQVVAIADEIAQRGHDIDDAITSGLIDIDELLDFLNAYKFKTLHDQLMVEKENIDNNGRHYVDERELTIGRIISCIVGYFINDAINTSSKCIKSYGKNYLDGVFRKKLIGFSKEGEACCKFLEKLINKRVIANSEVTRFDHNARTIIKKLFENYYKNPKLLHAGTLRRIYIDTLLHEEPSVRDSAIDLQNGNIDISHQEIREITQTEISNPKDEVQHVILEKRKILVRNIADYIAGMTDSYAVREYHKLK